MAVFVPPLAVEQKILSECMLWWTVLWQKQFLLALKYVGDEFLDRVRYYNDAWWPARELVQKAHNERYQVVYCFLLFNVFVVLAAQELC